jgi:hypothetical protein
MSKGFFQYGYYETTLDDSTYEDFLVADRDGLELLKSKIDDVLEGSDEVIFDTEEVVTDLNGIRIAERKEPPIEPGKKEGLAQVGCACIAIVAVGLVGLGVWKAIELLAGQ